MLVTFTRLAGSRYAVDVVRDSGPPAHLHVTSDVDDPLPHDLAHFLVEREFGLKLGIFGQLAAGGDAGTFWAAPSQRTGSSAQRAHRLLVAGRGQRGRSEQLVSLGIAAWEQRAGRRAAAAVAALSAHFADADAPTLTRVVRAFDDAASRWQVLAVGEALALQWPPELTLWARPRGVGRRLRSA